MALQDFIKRLSDSISSVRDIKRELKKATDQVRRAIAKNRVGSKTKNTDNAIVDFDKLSTGDVEDGIEQMKVLIDKYKDLWKKVKDSELVWVRDKEEGADTFPGQSRIMWFLSLVVGNDLYDSGVTVGAWTDDIENSDSYAYFLLERVEVGATPGDYMVDPPVPSTVEIKSIRRYYVADPIPTLAKTNSDISAATGPTLERTYLYGQRAKFLLNDAPNFYTYEGSDPMAAETVAFNEDESGGTTSAKLGYLDSDDKRRTVHVYKITEFEEPAFDLNDISGGVYGSMGKAIYTKSELVNDSVTGPYADKECVTGVLSNMHPSGISGALSYVGSANSDLGTLSTGIWRSTFSPTNTAYLAPVQGLPPTPGYSPIANFPVFSMYVGWATKVVGGDDLYEYGGMFGTIPRGVSRHPINGTWRHENVAGTRWEQVVSTYNVATGQFDSVRTDSDGLNTNGSSFPAGFFGPILEGFMSWKYFPSGAEMPVQWYGLTKPASAALVLGWSNLPGSVFNWGSYGQWVSASGQFGRLISSPVNFHTHANPDNLPLRLRATAIDFGAYPDGTATLRPRAYDVDATLDWTTLWYNGLLYGNIYCLRRSGNLYESTRALPTWLYWKETSSISPSPGPETSLSVEQTANQANYADAIGDTIGNETHPSYPSGGGSSVLNYTFLSKTLPSSEGAAPSPMGDIYFDALRSLGEIASYNLKLSKVMIVNRRRVPVDTDSRYVIFRYDIETDTVTVNDVQNELGVVFTSPRTNSGESFPAGLNSVMEVWKLFQRSCAGLFFNVHPNLAGAYPSARGIGVILANELGRTIAEGPLKIDTQSITTIDYPLPGGTAWIGLASGPLASLLPTVLDVIDE